MQVTEQRGKNLLDILGSAILALVLALIFGAFALAGVVSMAGATVLLWVAWFVILLTAVGLFRSKSMGIMLTAVCTAGLVGGVLLFLLHFWMVSKKAEEAKAKPNDILVGDHSSSPSPSPSPNVDSTKPSNKSSNVAPDVRVRFIYPGSGALELYNPTNKLANNIKYAVGLWDLDSSPDQVKDALQIPISEGEYIRPKESLGPLGILTSAKDAQRLKSGDRIFGFVMVQCPDCVKTRNYWVYMKYGVGGWYSEEERGIPSNIVKIVLELSTNEEPLLTQLVPLGKRNPIK